MFLIRPQAARGAADDFWYQPIGGGVMSASGSAVTPMSALRLSVVLSCVRVLSESVAKLPVRMYRGEFDEVTDHPVARLLRRKPNPGQTSFEFREMLQAHVSLRSNAYAQIVYRGAEVVALVPLHPDRVQLEQTGDWTWRYKVRDFVNRERVLMPDEVLHLKQLPMAGFYGLSTIEAQADAIGTALSSQQYAGKFFKNGAKHAGSWIEYPGKFATDGAATFRRLWREAYSGDNAYTTPVLDQGMKLHEIGMTNTDAQMIESRKYSDADLCRMFLVPQHMVGILDRSTNNNIEQQSREFYNVTLMGLLRRWEESLETALLTEDEQAEYRIEFDVDELLRADLAARGKFYHDAILDGWMTRNEARRRERMRPLDELDTPLEPQNMKAAGAPDPVPAAPGRAQALSMSAADRCVRREVGAIRRLSKEPLVLEAAADFYGRHADWMVAVLSADPDSVERACMARFDELRASRDLHDTLDAWEMGGGPLLLSTMGTKQ